MPVPKPIEPVLSLEVLSRADVERIHQATLEVLDRTGVRFPSTLALDILEDSGAAVDREARVARLPPDIVMRAMKHAPASYTLAARDPACDLRLEGRRCHLSTDGCGVEIVDLESGRRRGSVKQDVEDTSRVADGLDAISFVWGPMVSAQDVPPASRGLHELEACFAGTAKHVQPETLIDPESVEVAVEMGAVLVGGREALRRRPIFSVSQCAADPLGHDRGSLEASLVAAAHGIPTGFMPMPIMCGTGPATMAGNLVVYNADALSALVLMQLAHPGAPVFFSAAPTVMDLRTGGYTGGGPEDFLFGAACNQLARFYDVPLSMGTFATGAKQPDWQAAVDNSFSGLMPVLAGTAMLTGAGLLHGSRLASYTQLVLDCEIHSILDKVSRGIEVNDETLAVDVIHQVGPGGNYLLSKHTRRHMRSIWRPAVMDRKPYDEWESGGRRGAVEAATDRARALYREHRPVPLPDGAAAEMHRLIADFERRSGAREE
jgi:trimethylamine--corrinoid protein Co-methyltransferase